MKAGIVPIVRNKVGDQMTAMTESWLAFEVLRSETV